MKKALIGITPNMDYHAVSITLNEDYYHSILEAKGIPVILPLTDNKDVIDYYIKVCDGFLISGGPDMDARHFGEVSYEYNGDLSPYRDAMESYLVKKTIDNNKPILGVCRGLQVMNVVMGGTLYQDINSQFDRVMLKHSQKAPNWYPSHEIFLEKDSVMWDVFKKDRIRVNSRHHQAIKDVAPCFKVTSRSEDGIIESIEHKDNKNIFGIQCHPENMVKKYNEFLGLFKKLVKSCEV